MFTIKRIVLGGFFLLFLTAAVQASNYGSVYSLRGFGLSEMAPGPEAAGMGGVSLSILDLRYLNADNPAQFGGILDVRTTASFISQRLGVSSKSAKFNTYYANFHSMAMGLPVKRGIGVQFGILPGTYSNVHLEETKLLAGYPYTKAVDRSGGLNTFYIGVGAKIFPRFYAGIRTDFVFGKILEKWTIDFESQTFVDGRDEFSYKTWGLNATLGLLVKPVKWLSLGAVYTPSRTMRLRDSQDYYVPQITKSESKNWTFPQKFGVGASATYKRWLVGFDYRSQDWSKLAIEKVNFSGLTDERRISVGIEHGGVLNPFAPILRQLSLRAGFYRHRLNVLGFRGEPIDENVVTFGIGIPFGQGRGSIDMGLEAGTRGNLTNNVYKESILRFNFSVSGGERWFMRHKK